MLGFLWRAIRRDRRSVAERLGLREEPAPSFAMTLEEYRAADERRRKENERRRSERVDRPDQHWNGVKLPAVGDETDAVQPPRIHGGNATLIPQPKRPEPKR
jgi:hypothetical protein